MDSHLKAALGAVCAAVCAAGTTVTLAGCGAGSKPGALVGTYTVHGVLVDNTCGELALPTENPLDFFVEVREQDGVAYWMPSQASENTGTLNSAGSFRFIASRTQLVDDGSAPPSLEPIDFQTMRGDFDLATMPACALTIKETVSGTLQRRLEAGVVATTQAVSDDAGDLSAEHLIQVAPSSGSDCNGALAALGGSFVALPCEARYVLSGDLDTAGAIVPEASTQTQDNAAEGVGALPPAADPGAP